ncbi:MAG: DNA gyrase inhibitor YacG [Nitrospira sp.]|nr:DNA gyrase inhibitor YacG [Nitrospira sp.]
MTDLGSWAAEEYRVAGPSLSIESAVESKPHESESTG